MNHVQSARKLPPRYLAGDNYYIGEIIHIKEGISILSDKKYIHTRVSLNAYTQQRYAD